MRRKLAIAGLAAGLVGGGAAGLTLTSGGGFAGAAPLTAVQDDTSTTTDGSTTDGTAGDEAPAPGARLSEALQPLVDAGTITAEQRDAVVQALRDAQPEHGGRGGPGGRHGRPGLRVGLEAAASALGLTAAELRAELVDGQTIAEVAAERSVDVQTVIDAIVAEAKTHLDEKVAAGELTQEKADARLTEITERTTRFVNEGRPERVAESPAES